MVSPAAGLTAIKTIPTIELILIVGMVLYIDNEFYVIHYTNFRIILCGDYYLSGYFRWSDPNVVLIGAVAAYISMYDKIILYRDLNIICWL